MGRNTAFESNPEILKKLSAALSGGASREVAADNAKISLVTLLGWIEKYPEVRQRVDDAERAARGLGVRPTAIDVKPHAAPERATVDRWERPRAEAEALAPGETLYGWLLWLEGKIASHNERAQAWEQMPAMPPAVLAIFRDFWASGKQELLVRAGRGFGKSTIFCRPVLVECMFAPRVVNGGEIAIWPELSVDMDEANLKVGVLEKLLGVVGFRKGDGSANEGEYKTLTQERGRTRIKFINAEHEQIEIRVYPATVSALSGPTLKGARHDEEAKWKADSKQGTNSAQDVIDAEGGAFRGRSHAHLFRVSSAYKTEGPHYRDAEGLDEAGNKIGNGDTETRHVARIGAAFLDLALAGFEARALVSPQWAEEIRAYAKTLTADSPNLPSWFNPSLDPRTLKASSVRVFLREYGSRSSGAGEEGDFFDGLLIDAAEQIEVFGDGPCFCAIDPGVRKNAASIAIVRKVETTGGARFAPVLVKEWKPSPGKPLDLRLDVLPQMATIARSFGCAGWVTDVHALTDVEIVGARFGLSTRCRAEGDAYRQEYEPVRNALNRGQLSLAGCEGIDVVAAQLRGVSSELGDRGHVRIILPAEGDDHGDAGRAYVSACAEAGAGREEEEGADDFEVCPSRYAGAQ